MNCRNCTSWTIRGANFCHNCGMAVAAVSGGHRFESNYGNGFQGERTSQAGAADAPQTAISEHVMRMAAIALGAGAGAVFADIDPVWIGLGPVAYALAGPVGNWFLRFVGRWPRPEFAQEHTTTLRVEHMSDDKKHWLLYDFPDGIALKHVQWIAEQIEEGATFSRRKMCRPGKLSQGEFETIRDFWLSIHYAFYRDVNAPNRGMVLSERCRRLLKKSLQISVVDGGGWLTYPQKTTVLAAEGVR